MITEVLSWNTAQRVAIEITRVSRDEFSIMDLQAVGSLLPFRQIVPFLCTSIISAFMMQNSARAMRCKYVIFLLKKSHLRKHLEIIQFTFENSSDIKRFSIRCKLKFLNRFMYFTGTRG